MPCESALPRHNVIYLARGHRVASMGWFGISFCNRPHSSTADDILRKYRKYQPATVGNPQTLLDRHAIARHHDKELVFAECAIVSLKVVASSIVKLESLEFRHAGPGGTMLGVASAEMNTASPPRRTQQPLVEIGHQLTVCERRDQLCSASEETGESRRHEVPPAGEVTFQRGQGKTLNKQVQQFLAESRQDFQALSTGKGITVSKAHQKVLAEEIHGEQ